MKVMLDDQKDVIIRNFVRLVKCAEKRPFKEKLIEENIFTQEEIRKIFTNTSDDRHNRRILIFNMKRKEPSAFYKLIKILDDLNELSLSGDLKSSVTGTKPFCFPKEEELDVPKTPTVTTFSDSIHQLEIIVKMSEMFYDTMEHNQDLEFYSTRSKDRGRALIINNYVFENEEIDDRKGAEVDEKNLIELFKQIGFNVEHHSNQTCLEMHNILRNFASYKTDKVHDVCCVVIMSHGTGTTNETYIYGIDGETLTATQIQENFNIKNCPLFTGKPKVFMYQVCRGRELELKTYKTQIDSAQHSSPSGSKTNHERINFFRQHEDMLIGNATVPGYVAHRDPYHGTWYIRLICEVFMEHAHEYSVDKMLQIVDQKMRQKYSEQHTVQTSEIRLQGFRQLYLHPGIYMNSDGRIEKMW